MSARSLATTVALLLAATVWVATTDTLGGFSTARLNGTSAAASGQLSITHASCSATPASPSVVTACSGSPLPSASPGSLATSVQNTGTFAAAAITARYRVGACGVLQLANAVSGRAAMLPRTGTTFAPTSGPMTSSGSITLNGTTGYASNLVSGSEPTAAGTYGIGVWFKTAATSVSPLFGFGSNPLDVAGSNDRILYLDAAGKIGLVATTSGASTTTGTALGVTRYNDNTWHFAWVRFNVTSAALYSVTISVDGSTAGAGSNLLLGNLTSYTGYWHLGWSPVAGTARYFAGSLSGLLVDDSGSAPAAPATNPTSYTGFDPTRTDLWRLDDSGGTFDGTNTTGTLPSATSLPNSASDPCGYVDITWTMSTPTATVLTQRTLRAAATASWQTSSANPGPSGTQTATITLQRDGTFNAYAVGLLLYAPVESEFTVGGAAWKVAFRWSTSSVVVG